jgi:hypothetical protein
VHINGWGNAVTTNIRMLNNIVYMRDSCAYFQRKATREMPQDATFNPNFKV